MIIKLSIFDVISFDTKYIQVDNSFLTLEDYILNLCSQMFGYYEEMYVPESTIAYIHKDFKPYAKDFNMGTEDFFRMICAMLIQEKLLLEDLIPLVNIYRYIIELDLEFYTDQKRIEDRRKLILPYRQEDYEQILKEDKTRALKYLYFDIKDFLPTWQKTATGKKYFHDYDSYCYDFEKYENWERPSDAVVNKRYKETAYKVDAAYLKREYFLSDLGTHTPLNVLPFITKETEIKGKTLEEIVLNIATSVRPDRYFVSELTGKINVDLAKELIKRIQKGQVEVKDTGKYYKYFNVYNIYDVEKVKGLNAYSLLAQVGDEIYLERAIAKDYKKVTKKVIVPKILCYENYQKFCNANRVKDLQETEIKFAQEYPLGRGERKVNITGKVETVVVKDYDIYEDLEKKIKENGGSIKVKDISRDEETDLTLKRLNRLKELDLIERFYTVEDDGLHQKL